MSRSSNNTSTKTGVVSSNKEHFHQLKITITISVGENIIYKILFKFKEGMPLEIR